MLVSLLVIEDCPSLPVAEARLAEALRLLGRHDMQVEHVLVTTEDQARRLRFRGSPTFLVDGTDPFSAETEGDSFGLSCRVYRSAAGLDGAPTVEALARVLASSP